MIANDAAKISGHMSNVATSSALEPQQTGKKRGRKKGSKGIDSRLGSASNSSHSQQTGAPYYADSISFSSLKNKIDLIRGTSKKVKTTKELLAELQNKKSTPSTPLNDTSGIDSQHQSPNAYQDGDENGFTNGKHNSGYVYVISFIKKKKQILTKKPKQVKNSNTNITNAVFIASTKRELGAKQ